MPTTPIGSGAHAYLVVSRAELGLDAPAEVPWWHIARGFRDERPAD